MSVLTAEQGSTSTMLGHRESRTPHSVPIVAISTQLPW
jgi:hypothetical protein